MGREVCGGGSWRGEPDSDPARPRLPPLAGPPRPLLLPLHEEEPRGATPILLIAPETFLSLCGHTLARWGPRQTKQSLTPGPPASSTLADSSLMIFVSLSSSQFSTKATSSSFNSPTSSGSSQLSSPQLQLSSSTSEMDWEAVGLDPKLVPWPTTPKPLLEGLLVPQVLLM